MATDILVMSVEMGDGRTDTLVIKKAEEAHEAVKSFAARNCLTAEGTRELEELVLKDVQVVERRNAYLKEDRVHYEFTHSLFEKRQKFVPEINKVSKQIMAHRKEPVHNRLYKQGISIKRPASSSSFVPTGGDRTQVHSVVSPRHRPTSSSVITAAVRGKVEDRVEMHNVERRDKLDKIRIEQKNRQTQECCFNPKVDSKSEAIASRRGSFEPIHETLYYEAKIREEKAQRQQELISARETPFPLDSEHEKQLVSRLLNSHKRLELQLKQARAHQNALDKTTGLPLHKPDIRKSMSSFLRMHEGGSYSSSELKIPSLVSEVPGRMVSPSNSQSIYNGFREKQVERLFDLMDTEKEGVIYLKSFDKLDEDTKRVLLPVIRDLTYETVLTKSQFQCKVEALCDTLSITDRGILLKRKCSVSSSPLTASPILSPRSELLAAKSRSHLPSQIYERTRIQSKASEDLLYRQQSLKAKAELEQCTFAPVIKRHK